MADSVSSLSIKELKEILKERGVNFADCFEKSDLVKRVLETGTLHEIKLIIVASLAKPSTGKIKQNKKKLGSLQCNVLENITENQTPDLVVIMSHGKTDDSIYLI
jgi:hypothetical protein